MRYETLEDALYFVSSAPPGEHVAVVSLKTGAVHFASDILGHDDLPEDLEEGAYLDIPHKMELLRGRDIVADFVASEAPREVDRVRTILARPGGHSRYKRFLRERGLLEEWYHFEARRVRDALLRWCRERGIAVTERGVSHLDPEFGALCGVSHCQGSPHVLFYDHLRHE